MKKSKKIIITVLIIISILVIIGIITVIAVLSSVLKDDGVYKLGSDTITSINGVLDDKKVTGGSSSIENGVNTIVKTYQSDGNVKEELLKYANYLIENVKFLAIKDQAGNLEMAKESVDSGDIVYIIIEYNSSSYTVTVKKGEGTLTKY